MDRNRCSPAANSNGHPLHRRSHIDCSGCLSIPSQSPVNSHSVSVALTHCNGRTNGCRTAPIWGRHVGNMEHLFLTASQPASPSTRMAYVRELRAEGGQHARRRRALLLPGCYFYNSSTGSKIQHSARPNNPSGRYIGYTRPIEQILVCTCVTIFVSSSLRVNRRIDLPPGQYWHWYRQIRI